MKKSILEVYALAVCFVTIACSVVTLGIGLYDIIQISSPEFTLSSYEYNKHQSNELFWRSYEQRYDNQKRELKRPPEEDLNKWRLESYHQAIKSERRAGLQSLTRIGIILGICVVLFIIHWRIARRAREVAINTS